MRLGESDIKNGDIMFIGSSNICPSLKLERFYFLIKLFLFYLNYHLFENFSQVSSHVFLLMQDYKLIRAIVNE